MDIKAEVEKIASDARAASLELANLSSAVKNEVLLKLAGLLRENCAEILQTNSVDVKKAELGGMSKAMLERLSLSVGKIESICGGLEELAKLPDYVGEIMESVVRPNGISIEKVRVPIGVIAIIYESRPNVTIDCAALCLKSGNAAILRGGSECFLTNQIFSKYIAQALKSAGAPEKAVQMIPTTDRSALNVMLRLDKFINCIIPRGGEGLIRFVSENSTIPVLKHDKGLCNVYIDASADEKIALNVVVDAKCQRPSVCNAAENLIVDSSRADLLVKICAELAGRGVELRASAKAKKILDGAGVKCVQAADEDFDTEYDDLIISVDVSDSLDEAISFINKHSSAHSDCIITSDAARAEKFLSGVDSSTVYWNASTRFTDGFEFGFGAEIGISTNKLHARGPMGLKELSIYKYKVRGNGQTRGEPAFK